MINFWGRKAEGPVARGSRLAGLLADYPAHSSPHRGTNGNLPSSKWPVLSPDQALENLHAQLAATPERLQSLTQLLAAFGLATGDAHDAARRETFVRGLDAMLMAELPALWTRELGDRGDWEASDRAGPRIIHSMMLDLALLTGDVLIRAKPGCFWGLDLDPHDRRMVRFRRPCLLGLSDGLFPETDYILPLEEEWFGVYRNMDDPYVGRFGPFIGHSLLDRLDRTFVRDDLGERRRTGWMAAAV